MPGKPISEMRVDDVFDKALQRGLVTIGAILEERAKLNAQETVRTGRLWNSICWATQAERTYPNPPATRADRVSRPGSKDEVWIGTNVMYAPYVEYGTYKMQAHPYMRPALDNNRADVRNAFSEALSKALHGQ